jgi:hypothetical protein
MRNLEMESAVAEAVRFLSSRVAEQSRADLVPVSDIELRQLALSEETATAEQLAEASEFDSTTNTSKFEAKITKLLRRAYHYDVQHDMDAVWREHLATLRDHDIYVLVMVDEAKIPRPKPNLLVAFVSGIIMRGLVRLLPDLAVWLVGISGFVYFFILPANTSKSSGTRIFGNTAERMIPSEHVRLAVFVTWIAIVYLGSRRPWKK